MHAYFPRSLYVVFRVVTHMNDIVCSNACALQRRVKHIRVGFAGADILRQKSKIEIFAGIGLLDIGITVGKRPQGVTGRQLLEYSQRFFIQGDLVALL